MAVIKYYAPIRATVGKETETIEADTVSEIVSAIRKQYGKTAEKQARSALIVVNDISVNLLSGMKTKVTDTDTVGFLPVCGGG